MSATNIWFSSRNWIERSYEAELVVRSNNEVMKIVMNDDRDSVRSLGTGEWEAWKQYWVQKPPTIIHKSLFTPRYKLSLNNHNRDDHS